MTSQVYKSAKEGLAGLFPGYFAVVMATGIVSIAAHLLNLELIGQVLFIFNNVAYGILWILYLARFFFYSKQTAVDLGAHARAPAFFTMVAGTCVLGSQYVLLGGDMLPAAILWGVGIILWVILSYVILASLMLREVKPSLDEGINGTWLISVVATQSVSVLGTLLAGSAGAWEDELLFLSLALYMFGGLLYIFIITMIVYRLWFFKLEPAQLTAPYWINMGALAISTLAGDTLILNAAKWSFVSDLLPFLKGMNIMFWATATWWIPLMVVLGIWRHLIKHYPLRYEPQYWSLVFPLGMYTVCTYQLARALDLAWLYVIPRYFIYIAMAAWLATFIGLIALLARGVIHPQVGDAH